MQKTAMQHVFKSDRQNPEGSGKDKHDSAHRRRTGFGTVPAGTVLTDFLPRSLLPKPGNIKLPENGCKQNPYDKCCNKPDTHKLPFSFR